MVDPKVVKTSLLCKWIVKQWNQGNLTSNSWLGIGWLSLIHNKVEVEKLVLIDLLVNKIKVSLAPRSRCSLVKHGKPWFPFQIPPSHLYENLHTGVWWSNGLELIENGIIYTKAHELYCKGIQCVNNTWDSQHCTFLSWEEAQIKFKPRGVHSIVK